jgi:hypothetical protein
LNVKIPDNLTEEQKEFLDELKDNEIFNWLWLLYFTYLAFGV